MGYETVSLHAIGFATRLCVLKLWRYDILSFFWGVQKIQDILSIALPFLFLLLEENNCSRNLVFYFMKSLLPQEMISNMLGIISTKIWGRISVFVDRQQKKSTWI